MVKKMQETDTENEIREAYRVFDKERTGVIAVSEMRLILSNLPEKLSEEEIEEMLATADRCVRGGDRGLGMKRLLSFFFLSFAETGTGASATTSSA